MSGARYIGQEIDGEEIVSEILDNNDEVGDEYPEEVKLIGSMKFEKVEMTTTERCDEILNVTFEGTIDGTPFSISDTSNSGTKDEEKNGYKRVIVLKYDDRKTAFDGDDDTVSDHSDKIQNKELKALYDILFSGDLFIEMCLALQEYCNAEEIQ